MADKTMYFYLSLGSNVDAEASSVEMVRQLCQRFGPLLLFPFRYTEPDGIASETRFLNSLVVLRCELTLSEVKNRTNAIETQMGRDRSDPMRSHKARTADIDIIAAADQFDIDVFASAPEPYVHACLNFSGPAADLTRFGLHVLTSNQRAATVHFDTVTSEIRVLKDELHGFKHRFETAFVSQ